MRFRSNKWKLILSFARYRILTALSRAIYNLWIIIISLSIHLQSNILLKSRLLLISLNNVHHIRLISFKRFHVLVSWSYNRLFWICRTNIVVLMPLGASDSGTLVLILNLDSLLILNLIRLLLINCSAIVK